MAGTESERNETRRALAVIGLGILLADLLVVFFAPAGFRVGRQGIFTLVIIILAALGLGLVMAGRVRGRA
jgi:hypothetical protein